MQQIDASMHKLSTTFPTCTPCTLGIHSCCAAHGACRCDVDGHVAPAVRSD